MGATVSELENDAFAYSNAVRQCVHRMSFVNIEVVSGGDVLLATTERGVVAPVFFSFQGVAVKINRYVIGPVMTEVKMFVPYSGLVETVAISQPTGRSFVKVRMRSGAFVHLYTTDNYRVEQAARIVRGLIESRGSSVEPADNAPADNANPDMYNPPDAQGSFVGTFAFGDPGRGATSIRSTADVLTIGAAPDLPAAPAQSAQRSSYPTQLFDEADHARFGVQTPDLPDTAPPPFLPKSAKNDHV